jgi:archaellum biogenesis protein FlaJ (TadC family)
MAAEKLKGIFLTGIVSAGFVIVVIFIVVVFTNIGQKIATAASIDYVDDKDAAIEQMLNDYKTKHDSIHNQQYNDIIQGFKTLETNIIDAIEKR